MKNDECQMPNVRQVERRLIWHSAMGNSEDMIFRFTLDRRAAFLAQPARGWLTTGLQQDFVAPFIFRSETVSEPQDP